MWQTTISQTTVTDFLNSVGRNSEKTKSTYRIGLVHFQTFLSSNKQYSSLTLEELIEKILSKDIDIYTLFDNFISYLQGLSASTITLYVSAVKSFLQYHDVDISQNKFKRRVKLPKNHIRKEEALDVNDVREILKSCNNIRIKAVLYVLASSGVRITEALAIRNRDIFFDTNPTTIRIRAEYAKTRTERYVYISNEATHFLKEWLQWKYRDRRDKKRIPPKLPDDIVFSSNTFVRNPQKPTALYIKVLQHFHRILKALNMDDKKEGMNRNKITIHSLRRFVYTTICNTVDQGFAEEYLGHSGSVYHTMKESERREIYATKIMKYLTFLDFSGLETVSKNIEIKLEEKDRQIQILKETEAQNTDAITTLSDRVTILTRDMMALKKQNDN
ncbi:MAG: site-specific integrase [Thermoproteota archaeon]|nr:site-specific integrase [Thermoproteota archaeon]